MFYTYVGTRISSKIGVVLFIWVINTKISHSAVALYAVQRCYLLIMFPYSFCNTSWICIYISLLTPSASFVSIKRVPLFIQATFIQNLKLKKKNSLKNHISYFNINYSKQQNGLVAMNKGTKKADHYRKLDLVLYDSSYCCNYYFVSVNTEVTSDI